MKIFKKNIINFLYKIIEFIEKLEYRKLDLNEDDINKKIINSIELKEELLVESDTGLVPVSHIHLTQPYTHYDIKLRNGIELSCADKHILFDSNLKEVCVEDLNKGNFLYTKIGISEIISIEKTNKKTSMCDLSINHPNHRYYTNGILSHNTISAAIFMLHKILFDNDKNIMIVANKGDTAVEIVDKIKSIYTLLPFFLKPGIKTWNQKSLTFENGCRIKTSARTKTPAIGFTIDVLYLDEFAHIPSNIIEPYYTAAFPTTAAVQNSKIIITSTPNGMNLFHKLLTDAERPDGDPQKNNYKPMRVYWYQVPGRFVTYVRLNHHKLWENKLEKEDVYKAIDEKWGGLTKVHMYFNGDLQKDVIDVHNNDDCTDEDVRNFFITNSEGIEIPLISVAEVTTWKQEAIKDIGGEDAFNQEYGLRFINASKSLLNEAIIDDLLKGKEHYEWRDLDEFSNLRFSYKDLKWVDNYDIFNPVLRKEYKIVISVDIAEGLGQDYSIINIFKLTNKSKELIEKQKAAYENLTDFFTLQQIGMYRSNFVSVKQLAEMLYLISFEYFNPENVKVVLELNNYGNTLLAEMPHVFEGKNDYGSSIFVRYKHRVDSTEEKIGLKVGENKNLLVKDYQDLMTSKGFLINNEDTIREITTFVKHTTVAGNVRYAADVGHDDCLLPDTLIKTINGYKKIKDIKLGDIVLTHLGNWKKVTNICVKDFSGDMYKVKFKGQPSLDITYNHPIYIASENYSRKNQKPGNYNKYEKRNWVLPGDIKKKHRCVNIIEKVENQKESEMHWYEIFKKHKYFSEKNIKVKSIKFDKDFSKFVGLFLADGNCYKPNKTSYRVSISFNRNHFELINEIDSYLKSYGIKPKHRKNNKNGLTLIFNNKTFFELLSQCYNEEREKVLPTWYKKLDLDCVLDYWLKGDGWLSKREGRKECFIGASTSFQLALSMRDIALSLGRHALINKYKRHRYGVENKDQYWVTIYKERPGSSSLKKISDFEISSVIDNFEKYKYEGLTYNLEVEDDNSYIANGIVVHNCVMTIVNASSIFKKNEFKEMCDEWLNRFMDKEMSAYINNCLKQVDFVEGLDYGQVLNMRRRYMGRGKGAGYNSGSWFGLT